MNKNKSMSKASTFIYFTVMFTMLGMMMAILDMALSILSFKVAAFIFFSAAFILTVIYIFIHYFNIKKQEKMNTEIKDALENAYNHGEPVLLNLDTDDEKVKEIADLTNDLNITPGNITRGVVYHNYDLAHELTYLIHNNVVQRYAYTRFISLSEEALAYIKKEFAHIFISVHEGYVDIIFMYHDRHILEEDLRKILNVGAKKALIIFEDSYKPHEIEEAIAKHLEDADNFVIIKKKASPYSFEGLLEKYQKMDLNKENILKDFIIDASIFLPYSDIGILEDNSLYFYLKDGEESHSPRIDKEDYLYYDELPLFNYHKKHYLLVLASKEEVLPYALSTERTNAFYALLKNVLLSHIVNEVVDHADDKLLRLEELSGSLSYEIDNDYNVIHASIPLLGKFPNITKKKCYEAIYNRESPCSSCPIDFDNTHEVYLLGSQTFKRIRMTNNITKTNVIYLLNEPRPFVPTKLELQKRLLAFLNDENAKGYLLCVKLDGLEGLSSRNKTSVNEVFKEILKMLEKYHLTSNLYRKENDEIVYILEEATVAESIGVAKEVAKAFLEKFDTKNKEIQINPKMLLLSYPLEVNTLFSLDSLCRTMFSVMDKKGRLYRIDEEPLPIDNHRYYMEIVEESYKNNSIPFTFEKVKDNEDEKSHISYAYLNYFDNEGHPMSESDVTLYAKINNTYLTLAERVSKALIDYLVEHRNETIILPVGKEALIYPLFASIIGYFKAQKVDMKKIIFEAKEKDIYNHQGDVNKILEAGISLAMTAKDNTIYDIKDLSLYRYIKIDGVKLSKDKMYQLKVSKLLSLGISLMSKENDEQDIVPIRYLCK